MCRSIKTLRPPQTEVVTPDDVTAAALQYVRKVSGFRRPAPHNEAAFTAAVDEITRATQRLLDSLVVRGPVRQVRASPMPVNTGSGISLPLVRPDAGAARSAD